MIALLPTVLTAVAGAPTQDHAALHPADALLFVEVPDVRAALGAYERTAAARALADEDLHEALRAALGSESGDPSVLLADVYQNMVELGEMPDLVAWFGGLRAFSASVSVAGGQVEPLLREVIRLEEAGEQADQLLMKAVGIQFDLELESAEAARELLDTILGSPFVAGLTIEEADGYFLARAGEDSPITFVQEGKRLAVLGGASDVASLRARAAGEEAGLDPGHFAAGRKLFRDDGTTVLESYSALGEQLLALPEVAEAGTLLALAEGLFGTTVSMIVRGGHWRVSVGPSGRFVTEGLHAEPRHALDRVLGSAPLDADALSLVQPDAVVSWVVHFDKAPLQAAVAAELEGLGEQGEDPMRDFEEAYGFRPDRDLLDPLGTAIAYSLPGPRSLLEVPALAFSADLNDPAAFARGMRGIARWIEDEDEDGLFEVKFDEYREIPLFILRFHFDWVEELGIPFDPTALVQPTVAVLDDRVVLTTLPAHAKREIRRVLRDEPEDHPLFAAGALPDDATEVASADWTEFVGQFYTGAKAMLPMVPGAEIPFEVGELPEADVIGQYFEPTLRWKRLVGGRVHHFQESSFGPEASLALLAGTANLAFLLANAGEDAPPPGQVGIVGPAQPAGPEWSATVAAIVEVELAIALYRLDRSEFPESLDLLFESHPGHPQGYLGGPAPKRDAWGNPLLFAIEAGEVMIWSTGPDGVDDRGGGDDIRAEGRDR